MATPTVDQVVSTGDFSQTIKWDMVLDRIPGSSVNANDINLRCSSATVPKRSIGELAVNIRQRHGYQPGASQNGGEITLSLNEYTDSKVAAAISGWKELCWQTNTGKQVPAADTMTDLVLVRLDRLDRPVWYYKIIGAFLKDSTPGNMDSEGNSVVKPTMVLKYNDFEEGASMPSRTGV